MTDGAGTTNYTYDNNDQLASTTRGSDTFSYIYEPNGFVSSRTYPNGTNQGYTYGAPANVVVASDEDAAAHGTPAPADGEAIEPGVSCRAHHDRGRDAAAFREATDDGGPCLRVLLVQPAGLAGSAQDAHRARTRL